MVLDGVYALDSNRRRFHRVKFCAWKADKIEASQLAMLFRFRDDKIYEERWFVDTE